ncbi:biliverdin-producing heme oxygenase [Verrucomicrobium spinosum]|uniref:biliverdin-producing heme oxygenase n=1 Tax=Verrucomicrobium spinosum TaxID=2736 RepID=UPI0009EA8C3B
MPELLLSLKADTQQEHRLLEDRLDLFNRVTDLAAYRRLLESFYTLYSPLEEMLAGAVNWNSLGWDFEASRKTPWLLQDLVSLGADPAGLDALPRCQDLPLLSSASHAVGCLYVLEGSTLGGQLITKQFSSTRCDTRSRRAILLWLRGGHRLSLEGLRRMGAICGGPTGQDRGNHRSQGCLC